MAAKKSTSTTRSSDVKATDSGTVVKTAKAGSKATKTAGAAKSGDGGGTQQRFWLMYPPKLIKTPVIWEVGHKYKVITNVRQASVTDEIGIVCLELSGQAGEVKAAIRWLEKQGISVEPVEINVIES